MSFAQNLDGQVFQTENIDLQSAKETSFDGISRIFISVGKYESLNTSLKLHFRSKIAYFAQKAHDDQKS